MYLRISFKSQMLGRGVGVHAFLPFHDGYEDAQAPYPTLYFLPGYSANAEELATLLPLRRFSAEYGVAVIIPDGENSFYTDHPERCALFSSYVGDELVRVTRRMLPCLSTRREDTWIGGISMGYFITRKAWKNPEKRDAAVRFVEMLTSNEILSTFIRTEVTALIDGASPVGLNSLEQSAAETNAQLTRVSLAVQDAISAEAKSTLFTSIQKVVTGQMTAENAVATAIQRNE